VFSELAQALERILGENTNFFIKNSVLKVGF
jgi:hypothetical protein